MVVGIESEVGHNTSIESTVIGDKSIVADNVLIKNSILMGEVKVGRDSVIINCILGEAVVVAGKVKLTDMVIPAGVVITPQSDLQCYQIKRWQANTLFCQDNEDLSEQDDDNQEYHHIL